MNCLHLNRCQPLTGDDYALLRQNPDRGFRLEAYLRLGSGSAVFHPGFLAGALSGKTTRFLPGGRLQARSALRLSFGIS